MIHRPGGDADKRAPPTEAGQWLALLTLSMRQKTNVYGACGAAFGM
jgi:hypothetical protein